MRKQLFMILGTLSLCCFLSAHVETSDCGATLIEKGSKAESKVKIGMPTDSPCPGSKGATGATGPTGPMGATGPTGTLSSVYATLIQDTSFPLGSESAYQEAEITVPFSLIQRANGITFDEANNTFTLPKGTYFFTFQFSMATDPNNTQGESSFRFTDMYLDLNNDSSRIPLDWTMALNSDQNFNGNIWAGFSGSNIISVANNDTVVKFVLYRDPNYLGGIRFEYDPIGPVPLTTNNSPVRITIHKIGNV